MKPSDSLERVLKSVDIVDVSLISGSFVRHISPEEVDFDVKLNRHLSDPRYKIDKEAQTLDCCVEIKLSCFSSEDETPVFDIVAEFCASYKIKDSAKLQSKDCKVFALTNTVYNLHPYFREYFQTVTTKLGFPPVTLGFLRPLSSSEVDRYILEK